MNIQLIFLCIYVNIIITYVEAKPPYQIILSDGPVQRFGSRMYKKELLTDQFADPIELSYDSSSRNLFFMYMDPVLQNSGRAVINIVTKEAKKINGISRNKATAVDSETGDVYFGSEDGLYKYDPIENTATNIGLYNVNIMKLVIRGDIYLIDANDHHIYKVFDDATRLVRVSDIKSVITFDVDQNRNLHVLSLCGLYCLNEGHVVVKNKDLNMVYHFIMDGDKTYGITDHGVFDIDCRNGTATKVSEIDFYPRSIIFGDYGDVFYSIQDSIYRLKPIHSYVVYNIKRRTNSRN